MNQTLSEKTLLQDAATAYVFPATELESLIGGSSVTLLTGTNIAGGTAISVDGSGNAVQTWGPAPNFDGVVPLGYQGSADIQQNIGSAILEMGGNVFVAFLPGTGAIAFSVDPATGQITPGPLNTTSPLGLVGWSTAAFNSPFSSAPAAVALSPTSFLMIYTTAGATYAAVATLNGLAIEVVGTPAQVDAHALASAGWTSVAALTGTLAVALYATATTGTSIVAITVSGTTPSPGTPLNLSAGTAGGAQVAQVFGLSASTALATYLDAANGTIGNAFTASTISITGNTIELESTDVSPDIGGGAGAAASVVQLTNTQFAVAGGDSTGAFAGGYANVGRLELLTITDLVPSFGTSITVPGLPNLFMLDATHVGAAPSNQLENPSVYGSRFAPTIYELAGGAFSAVAGGAAADYFSIGPVAVQSAGTFSFVTAKGNNQTTYSIVTASTSGLVSAQLQLSGLLGLWLYPLDGAHALGTWLDTTQLLSACVVDINPITAAGPIAFASEAVSAGQNGNFTLSGVTGGFSGLTPGTRYYVSGDGSIVAANTGHKAGVATSATQLLAGTQ
jgi:hypothetical protein